MTARVEDAYRHCLQFATEQANLMVPRWVTQLNSTMQDREDEASSFNEKQGYVRARAVLDDYRERVTNRFSTEIAKVISGAKASAVVAEVPNKRAPLSLDHLELVDHGQAKEHLDLAKVQQVVRMTTDEAVVALLNAQLSRARGLVAVRTDVNPIGPDAVVSALMRALTNLHLEEDVRARWLNVGAVLLGDALTQLYSSMSDLLEQQGVEPAQYVLPQQAADGKIAGKASVDTVSAASAAWSLEDLPELLADSLSNAGAASAKPVANGKAHPLAAEIVRLMLRSVAEDGRLLPPVRNLVQGLHSGLMQLALSNPAFLSERENPVRKLLDAITAQGLAFRHEQDPGFVEFFDLTRREIGTLQEADAEELPSLIVASLRHFLVPEIDSVDTDFASTEQPLPHDGPLDPSVQEVEVEIRAMPDFSGAPDWVQLFLLGAWAQVVARARKEGLAARDGRPPLNRFLSVVPDLLWSSRHDLASRDLPRLIKMVPGILQILRIGLADIAHPAEQTEAFLQTLTAQYKSVYAGGPQRGEAQAWREGQADFQETEIMESIGHFGQLRD